MININRFINNLKCISMVIVLVLFTSCELVLNSFDKPVKEFFLENTSTASIDHHVINRETFYNPKTNAVTISSETDVTIIFYMKNPQSFIFTKDSNIFLTNDRLDPLPTLEQNLTDKSVLYLKLQKDLLRTFETESVKENKNKTLDFLIELKHPISNVDFQSYSFSIDCNSIPPTIFSPVYYQTDSNYVMAFNMPKKSDVMSVHNDLEKLIINGKKYDISIAEDGTITFPDKEIKSGDVKEVDGIQKIKAEFITLEDYQPFYFDTGEDLSQTASAKLSLIDTANFTSSVSISSNSNTLGSVNLKINEKSVNTNKDPIVINQDNDNNAKFTIIAPSHFINSEGKKENVSGVSVKYTLTNTNTNEVVTGSNNGSGSVTIDVPIGTYKLECISHKDYFADSITTFENIQINGSLFNFYVASGANDSNADGSISKPFRTIQAAVEKIKERNNDSQSSVYAPYKLILLTDICESDININPDSDLYLTIKSFDNNNYKINAQEKNKVMTIADNAFVTLENVTLTNGCSIYGTGGVEVYGSLTLSDNCIISNNTVTSSGYGAGIYLRPNAKLTMNGGKITENTGSSDDSFLGGGVYLEDNAEFVMNGGEISHNSAKNGGGVCVSGGTFKMYDGSISNNTANKGSGVYVANHTKANGDQFLAKFNISGGACIKGGDDVYLGSQNVITITGDTGELSSYPVATITPENYAEVQVLAASEGITLNDQLVGKFEVTKYSDNVETIITAITTDKGCLKNTLNDAAELNKDPNLYDICSTINVSTADGMKAISNLSQKKDDVAGKTFKGKTISLEKNVVLDDTYELIKTFSGVFDGKYHYITLTKPSKYGSAKNDYFGGAIFNVITGENAKVIDLNVSGEAYIAGIAIDLKNDAVISNCNNYAKITSPDGDGVPACGGIVGELSNEGFIENCKNEGTITYNSTNDKGCGGIVGEISSYSPSDKGNSVIANCINKGEIERVQKEGDVENNVSIGGICGEVTGNAAIYNCVNTGSVTSKLTDQDAIENIGGITGYCSVSFYFTEFTSLPGDMGIFNCYNSGIISSTNNSSSKYVGGIVGKGYVYTSNQYSLVHTIRVTNTVNNDETTYAFGNITLADSSTYYDIKNNFYKKGDRSPINSLYEQSFVLNIASVINDILNKYPNNFGREYLKWTEDDGNIVFSEEIIGN